MNVIINQQNIAHKDTCKHYSINEFKTLISINNDNYVNGELSFSYPESICFCSDCFDATPKNLKCKYLGFKVTNKLNELGITNFSSVYDVSKYICQYETSVGLLASMEEFVERYD